MNEEILAILKLSLILLITYGFPTIAIFVSILSYWNSRKAQKIKDRLLHVEERLKQYELDEKEKQIAENSLARIEARIIKHGKGYRLRIWNSGKAIAYNVDYEILDKVENLVIKDKVPYEFLESGKNFDEFVIVHNGTPSKVRLKTTWENEKGKSYSKEQIIQVY